MEFVCILVQDGVYTSPHENPWGMFDGVFLFAMAVVGTPLVSLTIFLSRRWLDVGASKLSPKKIFVNAFHLILASTAFFNALRILILIDVLR